MKSVHEGVYYRHQLATANAGTLIEWGEEAWSSKSSYEVDIDLPGFAKEEIKLELNNGYLTINAEKNLDQNKEKHGKLIRQERYSGSMQRSFYVGEEVTEEDVKASFQHGVLKLLIPKKEKKALPEKKTIAIE